MHMCAYVTCCCSELTACRLRSYGHSRPGPGALMVIVMEGEIRVSAGGWIFFLEDTCEFLLDHSGNFGEGGSRVGETPWRHPATRLQPALPLQGHINGDNMMNKPKILPMGLEGACLREG
eukprot:1148391-Pelagomonas_calceolata.AAC.1